MLNKVILIGNVAANPEIKEFNGRKLANFRIATSERWTDKETGEKKEATEWHNIVIYNDTLANIIDQYVVKGTKLYIEGAIKTRKWQDKDGKDRYTTEIVLQGYNSKLLLLSKKDGDNKYESQASNNISDEIPF